MAPVLDIALWLAVGLWVLFLLQLIINRLAVPDIGRVEVDPPERWPTVSIVVPARDEQRCVGEAVTSFCTQDYPALEVIVVDDGSTDATPRILADLRQRFSNLNVIRAEGPPPGWLGKPNALEIGRRHARGDWLLFVDADVTYAPDVVRRAVAHALDRDVGMLFLFPRLVTRGVLEATIMSSLYLASFAVIPLFLVGRVRSSLIAVGGGSFNLVRRDALEAAGAFESLKNAVIDDVGLGVAVKRAGFTQAVAVAGPRVRVRMYDGARATVEGFTKNIYPGLTRRKWALVFPMVVGPLTALLPYFGFAAALAAGRVSVPATVSLVCLHAVLGLVAIFYHMPWYVVFLNPVRELAWQWILVRSAVRYYRRGVVWRGRVYSERGNRQ